MQPSAGLIKTLIMNANFLGKSLYPVEGTEPSSTSVVILYRMLGLDKGKNNLFFFQFAESLMVTTPLSNETI